TYTFPLYTYYLSSFDSLDTYDVTTCVIRCTTKRGYVSFNIYFERDLINVGQPRSSFEVAITGSNGYDTSLCSQYCESQTTYNLKTAPKDGTPAKVCKFFNTYILTALKADGSVVTQGQYCSLYTEAWPIRYATNGGSWYYGKDQYVVNYSFGFAKTANSSDINPLDGDVKGAVYQAVADIKWSSLQPFCSTYLGYNTATATATTLPYDLAKYPATVVSSACSMQATPASSSSILTSFATSASATAASTTVV
ncbi:hypothetical protein D6C82_09956, partial [Aureobasidium pullulans]